MASGVSDWTSKYRRAIRYPSTIPYSWMTTLADRRDARQMTTLFSLIPGGSLLSRDTRGRQTFTEEAPHFPATLDAHCNIRHAAAAHRSYVEDAKKGAARENQISGTLNRFRRGQKNEARRNYISRWRFRRFSWAARFLARFVFSPRGHR